LVKKFNKVGGTRVYFCGGSKGIILSINLMVVIGNYPTVGYKLLFLSFSILGWKEEKKRLTTT
jgi:hypothetical protein